MATASHLRADHDHDRDVEATSSPEHAPFLPSQSPLRRSRSTGRPCACQWPLSPALARRLAFRTIKFFLPAAALVVLVVLFLYEPHIELAFYSRTWVRKEVEHVEPLAGCFSPTRISPYYNLSDALYGLRSTEVQAGFPMRMGLDCYNFAGTIQSRREDLVRGQVTPDERTQFHTYWRDDLIPFGERQEWMLKSFFATQDVNATRLTLWSNGDLGANEILKRYLSRYPDAFALRTVDVPALATGTALDGSDRLNLNDSRAWLDGDLVRLLLLWNLGGVWVDMDSLLTRDLTPLLEHEFFIQWDCYGKPYQALNGALMNFRKHSPYLCEAFHIMASSPLPRKGSTDWGSLLYLKLYRRLIAAGIPPFKVLPFCLFDGRSCRLDNRLPDPFTPDPNDGAWTMGLGVEEDGGLDTVLGKVFGVHLHNQWNKAFPQGGWVDRLLLQRYDKRLGVAEVAG